MSNKEVVPPELLSLTCCHPPLVEFVTALENAVGVLYSIVPVNGVLGYGDAKEEMYETQLCYWFV